LSEEEPKSALEIVMEKLRAKDSSTSTPLTQEQKAEIAEIKNRYRAKIAELEIRHQDLMKKAMARGSVEETEKLAQEMAREKERLYREEENALQKVRNARP
jgi:hypothetical protein